MDILEFTRAVAALAITLGLVGLAAVAMRKFGPEWMQRIQAAAMKRDRRLVLVESLPLDPTRRLVLVSLDGQERLILLGEGSLLLTPSASAPHVAAPPPPPLKPRAPRSPAKTGTVQ